MMNTVAVGTDGSERAAEAVQFATTQLALQNPQFIAWLQAYRPPK